MEAGHYLVGYDPDSGEAVSFRRIPDALVARAKTLAGMPVDDAEMVGDWPLALDVAQAIAMLAGGKLAKAPLNYCLEPHAPLRAEVGGQAAE